MSYFSKFKNFVNYKNLNFSELSEFSKKFRTINVISELFVEMYNLNFGAKKNFIFIVFVLGNFLTFVQATTNPSIWGFLSGQKSIFRCQNTVLPIDHTMISSSSPHALMDYKYRESTEATTKCSSHCGKIQIFVQKSSSQKSHFWRENSNSMLE